MEAKNTIDVQAVVAKVQTFADNGLRVTLDLPEQAVSEVAQLMELKRLGAILYASIRWSPPGSGFDIADQSPE